MSVSINNVTERGLADAKGMADYEVRINQKLIVRFRHKRGDGLAECLRRAADAVAGIVSGSIPSDRAG